MSFITTDTSGLARAEKLLKGVPGGFEEAVKRATGRALESARTQAVRSAVETYDTNQAVIRGSIALNKGAGQMISRGSPIELMKFNVSPKGPKRAMVRASVKKRPTTLSRAFVAQMGSGHIGVYERVGASKLPIRLLYSVSAAQMVGEVDVLLDVEEKASETFEKRLAHEVYQVLSRF